MTDLAKRDTDVLLIIRDNLISGLDKVVEHMDNGTMDVLMSEKGSTPRQSGAFTLMLLAQVNEILSERGIDQKW